MEEGSTDQVVERASGASPPLDEERVQPMEVSLDGSATTSSAPLIRSRPPARPPETETESKGDGGHVSIGIDVAPDPVVQLFNRS